MGNLLNLAEKRREKFYREEIPTAWGDLLEKRIPYAELLSDTEWQELVAKARILESEKRFVGSDGFEITQEMRMTVSAWGALLLLGRETEYFPTLSVIRMMPTWSESSNDESDEGSEERGLHEIELAWDEVLKSSSNVTDGVNVALHEFAHLLDEEDGLANGIPQLEDAGLLANWKEVMTRDYEILRDEVALGRNDTLLDPFGATNPAEFFAITVEQFFEWPQELRNDHPEIYALLKLYFKQDPAQRWDDASV